jgi:hypothetical protein
MMAKSILLEALYTRASQFKDQQLRVMKAKDDNFKLPTQTQMPLSLRMLRSINSLRQPTFSMGSVTRKRNLPICQIIRRV